jgi:hypothetical protein
MDSQHDTLLTVWQPEPDNFASNLSSVGMCKGCAASGRVRDGQLMCPPSELTRPRVKPRETGVQVDDSHPLLVAARHGRLDALKQQLAEMGPAFAAVADQVLLLLLLLHHTQKPGRQ